MLNTTIQQKILSVLGGYVLSTSMVARKAKLSRITAAKYLSSMESKHTVQAVRIGKAVAWRIVDHKPLIAILANTSTARVIKLALGDKYTYLLGTNASNVRDAFVLITDSAQYARTANVPTILLGANDERAISLPTFFDTRSLKVYVKKILHEQQMPTLEANAAIEIENFEAFEEACGIHKADELLKLTTRLLKENRVQATQFARNTFLIRSEVPEAVLLDIEQTFHVLLAHIYGRVVTPGEQISIHGIDHTVPAITITLSTSVRDELESVRH